MIMSCTLLLGFVLVLLVSADGLKSSHWNKLEVATILTKIRGAQHPAAASPKLPLSKDSELTLELVHRNNLHHSTYSHEQRLQETLHNDKLRLAYIQKKLGAPEPEDTNAPVTSGLMFGSGEYFVRLAVGTPPKSTFMVLDTGSDLPWLQCSPCKNCYKQVDPLFDPRNSTTFQRIPCASQLCKKLEIHSCSRGNRCMYQVSYGDGSFTMGDFSTDTFTLGGTGGTSGGTGGTGLRNVAFGCGYDNEGLFAGAGGLLGLGGGALSFASQLGNSTPSARKFSYCLVDRSNPLTKSASTLIFGASAIPATASFTPLLKNPKMETFYYAGLVGVSVAGVRVALTAESLQISESGSGGVIIDSGTSVTRLPTSVYAIIRDAFRNSTVKLPAAAKYSLFDTCFNFSKMETVDVPTVVLHFQNGADMLLPPSNYMVPINTAGNFCFAFAPTSMNLGIIGNIQQQSFRIGFDMQSNRIAFAPQQCK